MVNVEQAVQLLEREVRRACASVQRLIKVPLDDNQFAALVSFVYNLGGGALQRSTLRAKLNRGDYAGAAGQFKRWINANGRPMKGLMRRRAEEQNLFSSVFKSQDEANEWYNTMWGLQMSR
jgi:lysozyme